MPAQSNRKILREEIARVFTPEQLRQTLAEGTPSRDFDDFVAHSADFEHQVFQLIGRADNDGWLKELIDTLLEARAQNHAFVTRVRPIAERLAQGSLLDDLAPETGEAPGSGIWQAATWAILSVGIIGMTAATYWFAETLPLWTTLPLVAGIAFAAIGLSGIVSPGNRTVAGLRARDQRMIPGLGVIGLFLTLALSASTVGAVVAYLDGRKTVSVVTVLQNGKSALSNTEMYSELAASAAHQSQKDWSRTSAPNAEAFFKLRPNEFYRFGVKMKRRDAIQEGVFPARIIRGSERIELDIATIAAEAWLASGTRSAPLVTVAENESDISTNLPVEIRKTILVSRQSNVESPLPDPELRKVRGPLGLPSAPWTADRLYFTHGYDPQKRRPVFLAFKVDLRTKGVPRSPEDRFQLDPLLPSNVQPNPKDFHGSGYDRGHLVRLSDIRPDRPAVQQAYFLSVVVPQTTQSNRITWLSVEQYTSRAALDSGQPIWVLTGPIYRRTGRGVQRVVVLGEGATPVPTDLFRILARQIAGEWEIQAFLVPNDETRDRNALLFATSVATIEELTGLTLLPTLAESRKKLVNKSNWTNISPSAPVQQ